MTDVILQCIEDGKLHRGNISFDTIRSIATERPTFTNSQSQRDELDYGHAILSLPRQLNQYLHSYGPMVAKQWDYVLENVQLPVGDIRLIDYGCGQALALVKCFDKFGFDLIDRTKEIVLIEPSKVALARAEKIVRCYCPEARITCINKKFDDLTFEDLHLTGGLHNVHLLSKVLDVEGFDHFSLFAKIIKNKGQQTILAASNDRDSNGGSSRFISIYEDIDSSNHTSWLNVNSLDLFYFDIPGQDRDFPHIALCAHVEVLE